MDIINIERFRDFFQGYQDENGRYIYIEQIQRMSLEGLTSLIVDYDDLLRFDPELAGKLRRDEEQNIDPESTIEEADSALEDVLKIEDRSYVLEAQKKKEAFHVRFFNIPMLVDLRRLRAVHLGHFIAIEGIIIRQSVVKPLLVEGKFQCNICGEAQTISQEEGIYREPSFCVNPECGKKGLFNLLAEESKYTDLQSISIQERPETLPPGQIPRTVPARLVGDLVDTVRAGDRAIAFGILKMKKAEKRGRLATFDPWLDVNFISSREKEFEEIEIDPETEQQIIELSRDLSIHRRIIRSIAPSIYGMEIIKEALATVLFGGVSRVAPDGMKQRGESNILIVGDPGVAKSQLLQFIYRLAPRGLLTSGKASSAAGLTAAVLRDPETGEFALEAGALVLADRGICAIDEFDKMNPIDRSSIHEAMEQQTVSIAKAGIVAQLNARTAIIAAANPRFGRYEDTRPPVENINLPPTILSRFDLLFVIKDEPNEEVDRKMARHILELRRGHILEVAEPAISMELLRKYISYAKQHIQPSLTDEAMERIEQFYLDVRKETDETSAIAITPRYLEAIIRLSESQARMALKEDVTIDHVEAAINLLQTSLEQVGKDPLTGRVDIDILLSGTTKTTRSKMQTIIDIIKEESRRSSTEIVSVQRLKDLAKEQNVEEDFVDKVLEQLRTNGEIYSPRDGFVKLA
ncbi:MAG: minichromosome maintenance protein MCM [Candidatus Heimdallarchaeota archaeon]|nr:minichromosome maintenance protein MCM [Candidatus Heimdallarchaeota archaeon]MCK4955775.1 minichromosome maintenance protein MCM [Candidatus Heimdallarchaeota archaeon]